MEFLPPLSPGQGETKEKKIHDLTQRLANVFESEIKKHPQDWHMLQRVWKDVQPLKRINEGLVK
jgi:KDO2-lipid IV(A) lauroyltransferase